MALPVIADPPGFAELPPAAQIEYLQQLWDRIAADDASVPAPASHLDLAEQRLAAYRTNPESALPAQELLDQLAQEHQ